MARLEEAAGDDPRAAITLTLVRGMAGTTRHQREVVRGLGLRRIGATVRRPDTPMVRGMLRRVPHLVRMVEPDRTAEAESGGGEGS